MDDTNPRKKTHRPVKTLGPRFIGTIGSSVYPLSIKASAIHIYDIHHAPVSLVKHLLKLAITARRQSWQVGSQSEDAQDGAGWRNAIEDA